MAGRNGLRLGNIHSARRAFGAIFITIRAAEITPVGQVHLYDTKIKPLGHNELPPTPFLVCALEVDAGYRFTPEHPVQ